MHGQDGWALQDLASPYLQLQQNLIVRSLQLTGFLHTRAKFRQFWMNLQHFQLQPFSALEQSQQKSTLIWHKGTLTN
jgi:hypothetical protein